ncbi:MULTISPECIES: helix-turn-helix domain-containing protein [Salinibaculum]|uniref:helix-turn-helix domain-containing protein n=1 Tax=Salinibaculum TaxID=2732368 RepID=UPI0030CDFEAE
MASDGTARLREFTFSLHYEETEDDVMRLFHDHSDLSASAIDVCTGARSYLRVLQISGPSDAVERAEAAFRERAHGPESVQPRQDTSPGTAFPLATGSGDRTLYIPVEHEATTETVQTIVCSQLGAGTLADVHYHDGVESWRLLMPSDDQVGLVYDRISAALRDGVRFELGHIGDAVEWDGLGVLEADVSGVQEQALVEAVARGYYQRPREVTIDELAAELDVPQSTLSYRLRMGEATLVKQYVGMTLGDESTPDE